MASINAPAIHVSSDWDTQYINGEWHPAEGRESVAVTNPSTLEPFAEVPNGTGADVDEAYEAAVRAQEEWASTVPQHRIGILNEAIEIYEEHAEEIKELIRVETGGSNLKSQIEFALGEEMLEDASSHPFRSSGDFRQSIIPGKDSIVKREPVGVVGVITPWNFPIVLGLRAIAPAIALGNAVVLKPAPETPITGGLMLARIFEEAGLPEGVLNVVTGYGEDVGEPLVQHPDASVIAFTGSSEVGKQIAEQAAAELTVPALELGGNNPHVVTENADLDRAIDGAVFGSFQHQGQVCISINRHIVHESVYDEYVRRLADRASQLPVGDTSDEENIIGPLINESQRDKVLDLIERSVEAGANVETGGDAHELFVEPTVLSNATNDMAAACNEHFGPVAPVISYETDDEAIEMANDTDYGLSASVHSTDLDQALDIADAIEAGMVHINDQPLNDDPQVPFGGVKDSGMGRYNGDSIIDKFTQTKWVSVQRDARQYPF